ncbi:hypothetical protein V493_04356 [Pseudogymnoascus sp. VKM F-4281 (FW-2241)]|nr:hypothetical protein V493_04356 [Pseudogymnoascus sp. VKM F-4281 (FW-2241)]
MCGTVTLRRSPTSFEPAHQRHPKPRYPPTRIFVQTTKSTSSQYQRVAITKDNFNTRGLPYLNSIYIPVDEKQCASPPPVGPVKTWWGCGSHIPSVMDNVPESDRCTCEPKVDVGGEKYPPKAASKN